MTTSQSFQRLAVTCGEPAGIGPDLCVALAWQHHDCEIVVIADPEMLSQRAKLLNLELNIKKFEKWGFIPHSPSLRDVIYAHLDQ